MSKIARPPLRITERLLCAALFSVLVTIAGSILASLLELDWSMIFFAPGPAIAIFLAGLLLAPVLRPLLPTPRK